MSIGLKAFVFSGLRVEWPLVALGGQVLAESFQQA